MGVTICLVAVALCAAVVSAAALGCYEHVTVFGAGSADVNGRYPFENMFFGKPAYTQAGEFALYWNNPASRWVIEDMLNPGIVFYANDQDTPIPPQSGWYVVTGGLPAPTAFGGRQCTEPTQPPVIELVPSGGGGDDGASFLDLPLPLAEGEDPPMVGTMPLCGIFEVGEAITGSCAISGAGGGPIRSSYIHAYVYSVDVSTLPETLTLLDHWAIRYDASSCEYQFDAATTDLAPGYYDIRLSFADGSAQVLRIQITASTG